MSAGPGNSFLTEENKKIILDGLREGKTLTSYAKQFGITQSAIAHALKAHPEFKAEVEEARRHGLDVIVEGTLDLVENYGDAHLARVQSDIIWKYAAAMNRSKYGEKVDLNIHQTVSISAALEAAAGRIAPLMASREVKEISAPTATIVDVPPGLPVAKEDDDIDSLL
jgi:predicted transcriptional regulator